MQALDPVVPALSRDRAVLLRQSLAVAIPLRIAALEKQGGPTPKDFEEARAFGPVLAERGDVLQFGGKKGEAAELFTKLVFAVAVLAFVAGGIKFAGDHWVGKMKPRRKVPPPPPKRRMMRHQ